MKSVLIIAMIVVAMIGISASIISVQAQQDYGIPQWVKNNAGWWADDSIDDESFVNGIKYLIETNVMVIDTADSVIHNDYQDKGDFYITYKPNSNSIYAEDETAEAYLKSWGLLDAEVEFLNDNFRLPYDVEIIVQECNEANAFYDPNLKNITICYEFFDDVQEKYSLFHYDVWGGTDENFDWDVYDNYTYDVVSFVFWHEIGHAFIDIYNLPITGLEENVADQFAALMLLYSYDEETNDYSLGQSMVDNVGTWFYNTDYFYTEIHPLQTGEYISPSYWDVHALDMQRFYNVSCYTYGSNPNSDTVSYLIEDGWLPEDRASTCEWEYLQIEYSFVYLLESFDNGFFDYYFEE